MAFHWKEGWFFSRLLNGDVAFWNKDKGIPTTVIDRDSWLSIVASVSVKGDTAEQFQAAKELHG